MPMKRKIRRKSRKPRKTTRRKVTPKGKGGTFRTKVKKALMQMSETKYVGRGLDNQITLGNTSTTWRVQEGVFPLNVQSHMLIHQGTGPNERIGNRITLTGVRIPMYLVNETPEALRIRIMIVKQKTNLSAGAGDFINPLGDSEHFNSGHPWQADFPFNREYGTIVKQRTFTLNGSFDFGSINHRNQQFTGNSGIKKLDMGFSLRGKKHYFDDVGGELRNMDQYVQYVYVWRLHKNNIPYTANEDFEGLGNLQIRQFHKVYFKDV
jgi:hypothetical protein